MFSLNSKSSITMLQLVHSYYYKWISIISLAIMGLNVLFYILTLLNVVQHHELYTARDSEFQIEIATSGFMMRVLKEHAS